MTIDEVKAIADSCAEAFIHGKKDNLTEAVIEKLGSGKYTDQQIQRICENCNKNTWRKLYLKEASGDRSYGFDLVDSRKVIESIKGKSITKAEQTELAKTKGASDTKIAADGDLKKVACDGACSLKPAVKMKAPGVNIREKYIIPVLDKAGKKIIGIKHDNRVMSIEEFKKMHCYGERGKKEWEVIESKLKKHGKPIIMEPKKNSATEKELLEQAIIVPTPIEPIKAASDKPNREDILMKVGEDFVNSLRQSAPRATTGMDKIAEDEYKKLADSELRRERDKHFFLLKDALISARTKIANALLAKEATPEELKQVFLDDSWYADIVNKYANDCEHGVRGNLYLGHELVKTANTIESLSKKYAEAQEKLVK
jgi:hypothetical protein